MILGLDLGTQGLKALLLDAALAVRGKAFEPYPTRYPQPGWAEQDPLDWERALGIAHVPEGRRLFGLMTVRHNLAAGAYLQTDRKVVEKTMAEVFEHFPVLRERQNKLAKTLSGGEQQMLAMGRALMSRPKVILMDEPSMGLSPILVQEIAKIIRHFKEMGFSVLLIEQNAVLALHLADQAYVLETGSIALEGAAKELLANEHVKKAYLGG